MKTQQITIVKVSASARAGYDVPLIYLGKRIQKFWKVKKGDFLRVSLDLSTNRLILEQIKPLVQDLFGTNHHSEACIPAKNQRRR